MIILINQNFVRRMLYTYLLDIFYLYKHREINRKDQL